MNSLEDELSVQLQNLEGVIAPPSAVDVGRARAAGRTRRRRRRAAAGTGLAGGCLVVVLVAANLAGAHSGTRTAPVGAVATSAGVSAPAVLTGTDPLRATIGYGWLPDGVHITGFDGDAFDNGTGAALLTASGGSTTLSLMVLHPGQTLPQPHLKGGAVQALTTAPNVNGHAASWTDVPGSSEAAADGVVEVRWQYAPGSWAELDATIDGGTSSSVTETVYRVAENVDYEERTPLAMPFHVAQQPSGLPTATASWQPGPAAGPTGWNMRVAFQDKPTGGASAQQLLILVMPTIAAGDTRSGSGHFAPRPGETTAQVTVDGREAQITTEKGFVGLTVSGVNGLTVIVEARGTTAIADVGGAAGIAAYFDSLTILGSDPEHWTTAVVG